MRRAGSAANGGRNIGYAGIFAAEGVSERIIEEIRRFRAQWPAEDSLQQRVPVPRYLYYGKDVWEEAATALLCGENLLLVGPKATGKNVLAENLAARFRPSQLGCVLLHQYRRRHPFGY